MADVAWGRPRGGFVRDFFAFDGEPAMVLGLRAMSYCKCRRQQEAAYLVLEEEFEPRKRFATRLHTDCAHVIAPIVPFWRLSRRGNVEALEPRPNYPVPGLRDISRSFLLSRPFVVIYFSQYLGFISIVPSISLPDLASRFCTSVSEPRLRSSRH